MKPYTYALLAVAAACGVASAQTSATTTPVGYVTTTLQPNKYNLMSLTLHNPTLAAGVIASATSNSVTVTGANFTSTLTAGKVYILELPNGIIQEINAWTADSLTTSENISSYITGGTTKFKLREAATVSSVFGAQNSAGITSDGDEDPTNNDLLLIPNATGAFDTVYFFQSPDATGWFDLEGNPADNKVLNYADGLFVQRGAGQPINLVVTGEVKTTPTSTAINSGYNFLGQVVPTGISLADSQLSNVVSKATGEDLSQVDFVLKQNADGSYLTAYYFDSPDAQGWFDLEGNQVDGLILDSGFLIQNKGAAKLSTVAVPASYSSL
jgi:hypothetical protein